MKRTIYDGEEYSVRIQDVDWHHVADWSGTPRMMEDRGMRFVAALPLPREVCRTFERCRTCRTRQITGTFGRRRSRTAV
jgi:hypothetical protein